MGKHKKDELFTPEERQALQNAPTYQSQTPARDYTSTVAQHEKPTQTGPDLPQDQK